MVTSTGDGTGWVNEVWIVVVHVTVDDSSLLLVFNGGAAVGVREFCVALEDGDAVDDEDGVHDA